MQRIVQDFPDSSVTTAVLGVTANELWSRTSAGAMQLGFADG